jgi:outer membrane protein TolC
MAVAILLPIILTVLPASGEALTVRDAIRDAAGSNLEIRQSRLVLESYKESLRSARGAFDPVLGLATDTGRTTVLSEGDGSGVTKSVSSAAGWSASVTQTLPTGGRAGLAWTEDLGWATEKGLGTAAWQDQLFLTLTQPLLDGAGPLAARAELRTALRSREKARLGYQSSLENLAMNVSEAYWGLKAARENRALAERSQQIAEQQVALMHARKEEGFAASGDLLQMERAAGVARQSLVVARDREASAEMDLRRVIGRPVWGQGEAFELVDTPVVPASVPEVDQVLAVARDRNASIRARRLDVAQAEDALRVARNDLLPSLDFTGAVSVYGFGEDAGPSRNLAFSATGPTWSAGLDLSVPLLYRQQRAAFAGARLSAEQARLALEAAVQDLEIQVREAVTAVERDRSRVELAHQTVEAARAGLEADQELFQEGRGSIRQVVLSLESLESAQVASLQAEIDLQASILELLRVQGTLLEACGFN